MSRSWGLRTVACYLMGDLADLCRSHTKPPRTKLCRVRVVKIWILILIGFMYIVCKVQIKNCIFSAIFLSTPMLFFPTKLPSKHKWLFHANLTTFLGMREVITTFQDDALKYRIWTGTTVTRCDKANGKPVHD